MPIPLMLATLTDRRDFGDDWLLERKLDGERCVARKDGGERAARVAHRQGSHRHLPRGACRVAAAQRPRELLLDGEVVAYDGEQTSFSRLQQRLGVTRPSAEQVAAYPVVYCVFDLLEIDGEDLTGRPLLERRARLADAIRPAAALQLTEAWRGDSERRFAEACRAGWEGLIAKRADAPYARGRSKDWLKLKCVWEQEFVVGGYTDPAGSRTDFGALLVGYYEDGAAALRRQGRHRLQRGDAPRPRREPAPAGAADVAVRRRSTGPTRHALDAPRAGRPDRLRRVDERRSAAAAALPRAARRQAPRPRSCGSDRVERPRDGRRGRRRSLGGRPRSCCARRIRGWRRWWRPTRGSTRTASSTDCRATCGARSCSR